MLYFTSRPDTAVLVTGDGELGDRARSALKDGRLEVADSRSSYCIEGRFRSSPMLRKVAEAAREAKQQGFASMVAMGDASWLSEDPADLPEFVRYETGMNFLDLPLGAAFVCQYRRSLFSPAHLDQMRVLHDQVLEDGMMERSCWIIPRRVRARPLQ
jgi:hypothetical protein